MKDVSRQPELCVRKVERQHLSRSQTTKSIEIQMTSL
jgi:hypothetical protein